ncbi:hypothetical protein [Novosphingobium sp.]|uniref:hypothetical protein n=1 Tax=Novosphingobium sp. TaxID=1874826 RepID=UPI0031DD4454
MMAAAARSNGTEGCSFEAIKHSLRLLGELQRYTGSGHSADQASMLKGYVRGETGIVIRYRTSRPEARDLNFFFHRVPRLEERAGALNDNIFEGSLTDRDGCGEPDAMLVVRHLGDIPNKIVAAGRTWSSRVWLVPEYLIHDVLWEPAAFLDLSLVDDARQSIDAISPGKVLVELNASANLRGSEQRLIEGMPKISHGIGKIPLDGKGRRIGQYDLVNLIAGLTIHLDHCGERIILQVGSAGFYPQPYGLACPIDRLLRRIESICHDCKFVPCRGQLLAETAGAVKPSNHLQLGEQA